MQLVIANKRYSSWSLRPWLVMKQFALPFEEKLIRLDQPTTASEIRAFSPSGRLPCLIDGAVTVWETLAIIEYLADRFPDLAIWPRDMAARALARAISSEMHAGFSALRTACPMNLRKTFGHRDRGEAATADVARIEGLWRAARQSFGAGGPFLFGTFSAADAMFAPVVLRLVGYSWPLADDTGTYVEAITQLPGMREWIDAGQQEPWIVTYDEVDE